MDESILMRPIGVIRSPFKETTGIPIQGIFASDLEGTVELKEQYAGGISSKSRKKLSGSAMVTGMSSGTFLCWSKNFRKCPRVSVV